MQSMHYPHGGKLYSLRLYGNSCKVESLPTHDGKFKDGIPGEVTIRKMHSCFCFCLNTHRDISYPSGKVEKEHRLCKTEQISTGLLLLDGPCGHKTVARKLINTGLLWGSENSFFLGVLSLLLRACFGNCILSCLFIALTERTKEKGKL